MRKGYLLNYLHRLGIGEIPRILSFSIFYETINIEYVKNCVTVHGFRVKRFRVHPVK